MTTEKKSRCYDCKRTIRRDKTRRLFRINTQGKRALVRACYPGCQDVK